MVKNKMIWKIGDKHKLFGIVAAMGIREGEAYRMFINKDKVVSLIPLPCLRDEDKDGK